VRRKRFNHSLTLTVAGLMLMLLAGCEPPLPPIQPSSLVLRPWEEYFGVAIKPGSSDCYIVGSSGLLLTSHDGGKTWERHRLNEGRPGNELHQDLDLYAISFGPGGKEGWIVGEQGLIMHTSDGGDHWDVQHSKATTALLGVAAVTDKEVSAVGDHGTLLWSNDGGQSWDVTTLNNLTFYGIAFSDPANGWVVGEFQTILHSADGGKTWQVQRGGKVADFTVPPYFVVVPQGDQNVVVAGQSGVYASTKDGGKTWQDGKLPSERSVYGATAAGATGAAGSVWLAGAEGTIFEGAPGAEWQTKDPTFQDLTAVASSQHLGLAVGLGGTIMRTANGETWDLITESK
jgi:photosystem II stability/assembly factor-like uncharacterized protein